MKMRWWWCSYSFIDSFVGSFVRSSPSSAFFTTFILTNQKKKQQDEKNGASTTFTHVGFFFSLLTPKLCKTNYWHKHEGFYILKASGNAFSRSFFRHIVNLHEQIIMDVDEQVANEIDEGLYSRQMYVDRSCWSYSVSFIHSIIVMWLAKKLCIKCLDLVFSSQAWKDLELKSLKIQFLLESKLSLFKIRIRSNWRIFRLKYFLFETLNMENQWKNDRF